MRRKTITIYVTLTSEYDQENSDLIEFALEMVGMEFFNITIATDDHNEYCN